MSEGQYKVNGVVRDECKGEDSVKLTKAVVDINRWIETDNISCEDDESV